MIRLTVEQLYLLRDSIESSGQARTSVLPLEAMNTHRLIIAWAKTRTGDGLYLSMWKDAKAWAEARVKDMEGAPLPFDFVNDDQSMEYTHAYPINIPGTGAVDATLYQKTVTEHGRLKYTTEYVSAADSGHPEFGTVRENE